MLPGVKGETSSVKGNKINQVLISEREGGMGMGAQGRQGGAVFLGLLVSPEKRVGPVDTGSPSPPPGATPQAPAQLPGFPGYSLVAEDLFLHMVWENLCFWNNDNLFFPLLLPSNRQIL